MLSKEAAFKKVQELVERFDEQFASYKRTEYNETLARKDFIDPFFTALGWDMDNSSGNAEAYREVIHEDKIKISGAMKAPDYSFRLSGGKRLFFVEAKKPSVFVKEEIPPAYQLRRYGWSAKLPVSIITDFEEFAVYDCTKKPITTDKASTARLKYLNYKDYISEFEFLWGTFSKERVLKGSFDKFVQSDTQKRGTTTVDKEFLNSLDEWRKELALNIALRNEKLNEEELNFVVQQTIDRIIFLRIAEDRSVEGYGRLKDVIKTGDYYNNLYQYFREADEKYNSGLFDFRKDNISKKLAIDNKVIKDLINELYYPLSPYEFSVLSVEILGSAYEQFLGKQIKLSAGHRAIIEEKPEVRKAGGVYYTPQYIVEYIVNQTVGKLVEGKTPKEASKLRIVDPACGSGSFLIGAYQFLLDWHKDFYTNKGKLPKKGSPLTPEGNLTTAEKKRILLNNIYGVDIDLNAVEVTKLSLLLKCMEGETNASIQHQLKLFNERVLPTLDNNIKSGNSLIDTDFYDGQFDFDPGAEKKIKPFNWQSAFSEVFKQGGFDAVIGNPPWGAELHDSEKKYLINKVPIVPTKTKDTYFYFLFRALEILKKNCYTGLVLPNTWLLINNAKNVREFLLEQELLEVIDFGDNVFKGAIVETTTLVLRNRRNTNGFLNVKRYKKGNLLVNQSINKEYWAKDSLSRFVIDIDETFDSIYNKAISVSISFVNDCEIIFGIKPYQLGHGKPPQTKEIIENRVYHSSKKGGALWKPLLTGSNINRYVLANPGNQFIKYGDWLMYRSNEKKMIGEKILLRRTSDTIRACYDNQQFYGQNSLFVITSEKYNLKYLLAILNSSFLNYIYKKKCPQTGKIFAEIKPSIIKELPIKTIDFKNKSEKSLHDEIVKLVDTMLELNKQKQQATLPNQIEQLEQRISHTDKKIDQLVYQLYGLTDEEIKIVESQ